MDNIRVIVIHDEHSQASRALAEDIQALQASGELTDELHVLPLTDALKNALPIRAVPVVLCLTAYSQEETVTAVDMLRKINFYKQQEEIEEVMEAAAMSGALGEEGVAALARIGMIEADTLEAGKLAKA